MNKKEINKKLEELEITLKSLESTKQGFEALKKELQEAKEEIKEKELQNKHFWMPEGGEIYWSVDSSLKNFCPILNSQGGEIYWSVDSFANIQEKRFIGSPVDNNRLAAGNVFRTKEEAQAALDKARLIVELKQFADDENDGWIPDWMDNSREKWYVYFHSHKERWDIGAVRAHRIYEDYRYYPEKEIAKKVLEKFGDRLNLLIGRVER